MCYSYTGNIIPNSNSCHNQHSGQMGLESTAKQIMEDIRWTQHLAITNAISHYFELILIIDSIELRA